VIWYYLDMKLYHVTTTLRWNQIKTQGLIPGIKIDWDSLTDRQRWMEDCEREFAGDFYCGDSNDVICLATEGSVDMRYGDILLKIELESLDATRLTVLDGDLWDINSQFIDENPIQYIQANEYTDIEIRFSGSIPTEKIKRSFRS